MKSLGLRGFKIIGDNVDLYIHVRDMRQKHQNRSIHWFHLYAVLNRVPSSHLDNAKPQKELRDVPNSDFFLRNSEYTLILTAITEIVSRILVNNLTIFQGMQNSVRWHLEHKHSTEMAQKSVQVLEVYSYIHLIIIILFRLVLESCTRVNRLGKT